MSSTLVIAEMSCSFATSTSFSMNVFGMHAVSSEESCEAACSLASQASVREVPISDLMPLYLRVSRQNVFPPLLAGMPVAQGDRPAHLIFWSYVSIR